MWRTQIRQATGNHDRLVVATAQRAAALGLERAEVTAQAGPAEFVVERGRAKRAVTHDLERAGHARRQRTCLLPRPRQIGDTQVRRGEPGQPGLGLAAAAGCALVADLATGAGGGTRKRRNRGRMVVGLDLDRIRYGFFHNAVFSTLRISEEALGDVALNHRGIVVVGRQCALRRHGVGVLDHREQ